jgi:hypothetical protein
MQALGRHPYVSHKISGRGFRSQCSHDTDSPKALLTKSGMMRFVMVGHPGQHHAPRQGMPRDKPPSRERAAHRTHLARFKAIHLFSSRATLAVFLPIQVLNSYLVSAKRPHASNDESVHVPQGQTKERSRTNVENIHSAAHYGDDCSDTFAHHHPADTCHLQVFPFNLIQDFPTALWLIAPWTHARPRSLTDAYLEGARPTLSLPRSYTEYHFLRNASPRMAIGPGGEGKSMPMNDEMQEPWTSRM